MQIIKTELVGVGKYIKENHKEVSEAYAKAYLAKYPNYKKGRDEAIEQMKNRDFKALEKSRYVEKSIYKRTWLSKAPDIDDGFVVSIEAYKTRLGIADKEIREKYCCEVVYMDDSNPFVIWCNPYTLIEDSSELNSEHYRAIDPALEILGEDYFINKGLSVKHTVKLTGEELAKTQNRIKSVDNGLNYNFNSVVIKWN